MKFSQISIKSIEIISSLAVFIAGGIVVLITAPGTNPDNTRLLAAMLFLVPLVIIGLGLLTQITIDEEGISVKGLFNKKQFTWQQVRSARVYQMKYYQWIQLEPRQYDPFNIWGKKFVFVSDQKSFWPARGANSTAIRFHYRKDAYERLVQYLDRQTNETAVAG